ncbi:tetratricopeptide repeat protein [Paraburkholderia megapolitana]|uniref:Glycosyltransferase family 9 (Heptosyltransferase) n=1 Tax=Paraburkholderia megapolitana TaxID=420953 RepID=A0A1I3E7V6_9BURK|nr:hypothetical protein [Paraburkholderia megapolitana]QDQ81961.1 hypothetical protein FNZ07_01480 [Paraburkholderia megapolitana]SFH94791.1 hypothetical protein SAMN05192543_101718 [Paraburkholderia megapolitana]
MHNSADNATIELEQRLQAASERHTNNPHDLSIIWEAIEILTVLKREDRLLPWADRALALSPHHADFRAMRATALNLLGRHAEAAGMLAHDLSTFGESAIYRLRLGYSLMMAGDLARAIPLLDEVRQIADSMHVHAEAESLLGEAMLKAGDPRGFTHWQMRSDSGDAFSYRPADIPEWTGEPDLRGQRVLITHQLGFGDNFLLAACVADWRAAGASMMITCAPQIHQLMQASLPDCEVVSMESPQQSHAPLPDAVQARVQAFAPHLHATLLRLPLLNASHPVSGYRFRAYLRAPSTKQQIAREWAQQLRSQHPGKRLVGLFWDCRQRHMPELGSIARCWAARRSLPLEMLNRITTNPAVTERVHFVNLHHPLVEAQAGTPAGDVSRYLPGIFHFDDTAACIGELDAVFAVDSAVANLAAMMSKPTCVPVNTSGDWRWGTQGTTTPWIEGATVLRQTREGDWDSVVQDAATWLTAQ